MTCPGKSVSICCCSADEMRGEGSFEAGKAVCSPSAGTASARSSATEAISESSGRRRTRSTIAGQKRESAPLPRCGSRGIRPRSIRGPSSSSTAGRTVIEPATAQAITAIVPLAIPLKIGGADHELAGHRDRHGRAGDEDGVPRGACGALERLVRGEPSRSLLA